MQNVVYVNPLSGEILHQQPGTSVETEILDTLSGGPVFEERDSETSILSGTVTITVESVRPNEGYHAYMESARKELDSPEGRAALAERVAELPEAERESVLANVRALALKQAEKECPYPSVSIVRQTMSNIPAASAAEAAKAIRDSAMKGKNKLADLLSATAAVPKGAWQ